MTNLSFAAAVAGWAEKVEGAVEAVFKESAQAIVEEMDERLVEMVYRAPPTPNYNRTGFLRASLMASTSAMPSLDRPNPGGAVVPDMGQVELTIAGAEIGSTIFAGYTASYAYMVHSGANGATPRPWVVLTAQRWPEIVASKAAELKSRLGL